MNKDEIFVDGIRKYICVGYTRTLRPVYELSPEYEKKNKLMQEEGRCTKMILKDKYGITIDLQQAKNGKIIIPIGDIYITLSKVDAEKFILYDIENFDLELYKKAYKDKQKYQKN